MNQIRWSTVAQHAIPDQPHQLSRIRAEGLQTMVIPGGQLREGQTHRHQSQGIKLPTGEPGILNVVATDSHTHTSVLQLPDWGQRATQGGGIASATEKPAIGERQGHHLQVLTRHPIGQTPQSAIPQQRQAAGMAAGHRDRHLHALHHAQKLAHSCSGMGRRLIDVKVDKATMLIGQLQQPTQAVSFVPASTWGLDEAPEGATGRSHRGCQLRTLGGGPVLHRHESYQLQLQPIPPLLSQSGERLPAAGSTRPETVDMAAYGSQPMTPRQLKCTLAAGLNLLKGARLVLSVVGRQSRLKRADGIGIVVPGEGFI